MTAAVWSSAGKCASPPFFLDCFPWTQKSGSATGCEDSGRAVDSSVVQDPDFWSPILPDYKNFLDPDWILYLLNPDLDYPRWFEKF